MTAPIATADPATAIWLDGPGFAAWLEGEGVTLSENDDRMVRRWREGASAKVWAVDRILTNCGLHIAYVPDDLFIDFPDRPGYTPRRVRREAVRRFLAIPDRRSHGGRIGTYAKLGRPRPADPVGDLAAEYGIERQTLMGWARAFQKGTL